MKWLQVDTLIMYPRIKVAVKETLDNLPGFKIQEHSLKLSQAADKIHMLLVKLMRNVLAELTCQFKRCFAPDTAEQLGKVCTVENAILRSFQGKLRDIIGSGFNHRIGFKIKALLNNVEDIKALIYALLNRCCVEFFIKLKLFKFRAAYEDADRDIQPESAFSIWRFCDDVTSNIIEEMYLTARNRVYKLEVRDAEV